MVKSKCMPPADFLRDLFEYDPESGLVYRKKTVANRSKFGDTVGSRRPDGYLSVRVGSPYNRNVFIHRLVWKLITGEEPNQIDHINGVRDDNRWVNLRNVDAFANAHNKVNQGWTVLPNGRYRASITVDGERSDVGYFNCQTAAKLAYIKAKIELGIDCRW